MSPAGIHRITTALDRHFETADPTALDEACRLARSETFDIAALLAWLESADADDAPKDLAIRRVRAAIGLPPMPGAACRPVRFERDGRVRKT